MRRCSADFCEEEAVTQFVQSAFCVNHFVSRCYADLQRLDPRVQGARQAADQGILLKAFAEECAQKALEISLRGYSLDNLQRGRLLDILLWAGEILPESLQSADRHGAWTLR